MTRGAQERVVGPTVWRLEQGALRPFMAAFVGLTVALVSTVAGLHLAHSRDLLPSIRERSDKPVLTRPDGMPTEDELERAGATIGAIRFEVGNIFDTASPAEDVALFRLGNLLHVRTKPSVIERQLLFREGDRYSRQKIEESERLLRAQPYLVDVRILPEAYRDGRVDLRVVTRDVWTLKPGISIGRSGGTNRLGASIEESNLLGFGKRISIDYVSNVDRKARIFGYVDPQWLGSRWTLASQLGSNSDGHKNALAIEHPFFALDTRWSAGLRLLDEQRIDAIYDLGERTGNYRVQARGATAFYGISEGLSQGWTKRWTAGFTYDRMRFEATDSTGSTGFVPDSRTLAYPWLRYELLQDKFERLENLNQIGRVEDMNFGWQASARIGLAARAWGADRQALILDSMLSRATSPGANQIIEFRAGLAGRLASSGVQNGKLSVSARYYWRTSPSALTLAGLMADVGRNLDADERLTLGGDNGLRGYPLRYQTGSGRALFTAEQRLFTDWYPFRLFRVGAAVFMDIGRTWGENPFGSPSAGLLRDVGVGLRIGQARSGLGNVTHVNLAFPLDARGDIKRVQFIVETKASF